MYRQLRSWVVGASVTVIAITAGYSIGHATSPFPSGAPAPQIISGNLVNAGTAVTGTHSVALNLWRSTDTATATNRICQGATQSIAFDDTGNFKAPLDATCTEALSRYTQVWYQLVVDGSSFPLQQIGAVPFAARSLREAADGSRLKVSRKTVYGDDGYRSESTLGKITDTARGETCSQKQTVEGGNVVLRCLPDSTVSTDLGGDLYMDDQCTQRASGPFPYPSATPYVATQDQDGNILTIAKGTLMQIQIYGTNVQHTFCNPYTMRNYISNVGAPLDLTSFVKLQEVDE